MTEPTHATGHVVCDPQARRAGVSGLGGDGHVASDPQTVIADSAEAAPDAAGHTVCGPQVRRAGRVEEICHQLRAYNRPRRYAEKQRKSAVLSLGAFLRTQLGWRLELPAEDRAAIARRAQALIKYGVAVRRYNAQAPEKRSPLDRPDPVFAEWHVLIAAALLTLEPWLEIEKPAKKAMVALATELPVWDAWAAGIRGFGADSLATIVAEAGNLSNYRSPDALWKRFGLAVLDGVRQGGLSKTASADDWIAHGYRAARRAVMWNVGDPLIKQNGDDGYYRTLYLARKITEREHAEAKGLIVLPAAKIPAGQTVKYMSDGHVHNRAQRYMEKRLLRHLWMQWRRAGKE